MPNRQLMSSRNVAEARRCKASRDPLLQPPAPEVSSSTIVPGYSLFDLSVIYSSTNAWSRLFDPAELKDSIRLSTIRCGPTSRLHPFQLNTQSEGWVAQWPQHARKVIVDCYSCDDARTSHFFPLQHVAIRAIRRPSIVIYRTPSSKAMCWGLLTLDAISAQSICKTLPRPPHRLINPCHSGIPRSGVCHRRFWSSNTRLADVSRWSLLQRRLFLSAAIS